MAKESNVAPMSKLTEPTNGLSKAADALNQTGLASERATGKTCNSMHRPGTNKAIKAVGRSSWENRLRSPARKLLTTATVAIASTAETAPLAMVPSTSISAGRSAINEISKIKAAVIAIHQRRGGNVCRIGLAGLLFG